ncbi:MAG: Crp/Fnr family transcriptional regulator [Bdellovibrionales bacterium]|nr:Crp/Fnr family transcriptional regulator [Bdellovibrionales bacterium]
MIPEHQLRQIALFKELDSAELAKLGAVIQERRIPKGSYIVYEGDPGPSMMFLLEGKAKVNLVSPEGKEIVLANLDKGEFFGEISVLTGEDRSANVVATTDCRLLVFPADEFKRHVSQYPGLAFAMMKELALRLRASSEKIGDLVLYDVYRRVARTLKGLAKLVAVGDEEKLLIEERPTHQELANMVGTSREMVTRALKGLEEDGCIIIDNKRIEVRKMPI